MVEISGDSILPNFLRNDYAQISAMAKNLYRHFRAGSNETIQEIPVPYAMAFGLRKSSELSLSLRLNKAKTQVTSDVR